MNIDSLAEGLRDPDPEVRCQTCESLLRSRTERGIEMVLPLLHDLDITVRWVTCGALHDFGDERAVDGLIERMTQDSDPQVRGTAAYALGGIGSPRAIPALLKTLESDHKYDELGHSPSSSAATALDDIMGTEETRIRCSESLRMLRPGQPNLEHLKQLAIEFFEEWKGGQQSD